MSTKKSSRPIKRDIETVVLITPTEQPVAGTIEAHAKSKGTPATRSLRKLKEDWVVINQQVVILLDQTEKKTSKTGFELDEVSFALGINAKGQIGFLAGVELGGDASITLTFKRKNNQR